MRFTRTIVLSAAVATAIGAAIFAGVAHAQGGAKATVNDPAGPVPMWGPLAASGW